MTVQEALLAADKMLPGIPSPDGTKDPRWQAIIRVGDFVEHEPEAIWPFVQKWGSHEDEDVQAAIATCLLEHLLEYHFDLLFPRVEIVAKSNSCFAKTTVQCYKLGKAKEPTRAARFDRLCSALGLKPL
jgi:hypothetical protein